MSTLAMGLASIGVYPASKILTICDGLQVFGIDAPAIPAEVVENETFGNGPFRNFISDPVSHVGFPSNLDAAVSSGFDLTIPLATIPSGKR